MAKQGKPEIQKIKADAVRILGIETSCDETSVALLEARGSSIKLVHHETATQIPIHARFGGVVPEVAARTHVAELVSLLERAGIFGRGRARSAPAKFDVIAVTKGPGLATALRVGVEAARTIAWSTGVPLVGVNHLEGHMASAWLMPQNRKRWKFPILVLLVSGGHTELVLMRDYCSYRVLGRTRDDAAGEAFDKTAKLLGLGYPGGPALSKQAERGRPDAFKLPRPMLHDKSLDMSFSGLKTAVRVLVGSLQTTDVRANGYSPRAHHHAPLPTRVLPDLCASIQAAIVDVLVAKTVAAALKSKPKAVAVVGGVSANRVLQAALAKAVKVELPGVTLLAPPSGFYTDNSAMIAAAGLWRISRNKFDTWQKLDAEPELDL
jgi:N6-L-threonylcarbamoyladenine synthase